jgi:hypothetical protein
MTDKEANRFEEETMDRMTVITQRQEEQAPFAKENSNLSAIADLGNLVRESEFKTLNVEVHP